MQDKQILALAKPDRGWTEDVLKTGNIAWVSY